MTQLNNIKLSKRLQAIYDLVPQSNVLADIGSDHAFLPIALVLNGKVTRAYAVEVNEGPYDMTVKNIAKYNVENYITPMLSDGISELEVDVNTITICGMGGNLIVDILDSNKEEVTSDTYQLDETYYVKSVYDISKAGYLFDENITNKFSLWCG